MSTIIASAVASCGASDANRNGKAISIDREVILFPEWFGGVTAITKLASGELVVTGKARTAWAFATDNQGTLLWKYQDPVDMNNDAQALSQTEYREMVPLANGNILLCGRRNYERGYRNLILILDSKGNRVEQREEVPRTDARMTNTEFQQCFAWNGGGLLLGTASNQSVHYQWMVTVDGDGKKIDEALFNLSDAPSADPDKRSVLYDLPDADGDWRIYRVSSHGKIVASREVILGPLNTVSTEVRSTEPTDIARLIVVPLGKNPILYTLNARLEDVVPPHELYNLDTSHGVRFARSDGSLALFGQTSSAAVAWVASNGRLLASHELSTRYRSLYIKDAVPVSANQYVTIRDGITKDANDRGVLMDWVTFHR